MTQARQLTTRVAVALVAFAAVAAVATAWMRYTASSFDEGPLPQGAVAAPDPSTLNAKSEFRAVVYLGLDAVGALLKRRPIETKIGKVEVSEILLSQMDESRVQLKKASAKWNGDLKYLGIPVKSATVDLAGTVLQPQVDEEWVLQGDPDVRARVSDPDVRSWLIADDVAEILVNNDFILANPNKWLRGEIADRIALPLKKPAEVYWSRLNADTNLAAWGSPINGVLYLRPIEAFVAPPIVEDARRRLRIGIGVDYESVLTLGDSTSPVRAPDTPLPSPKKLPLDDWAESHLRLPIVVRVSELSTFWRPCSVPGLGEGFRIEAIDLTENDGLLHGRMHFLFHRDTGWSPLLPRDVKGIVRFQGRPKCDFEHGRLGLSDFTFTEKSNSYLIDLVGEKANGLIRTAIEEAVPVLSRELFDQAAVAASTYVKEMVADGIARWAESSPVYAEELKRAEATISGIALKPSNVSLRDGYMIVTLEANPIITLSLADPAPESKPSPNKAD